MGDAAAALGQPEAVLEGIETDVGGGLDLGDELPRLARAAILAYTGSSAVTLGDRLHAIPLGTVLA